MYIVILRSMWLRKRDAPEILEARRKSFSGEIHVPLSGFIFVSHNLIDLFSRLRKQVYM